MRHLPVLTQIQIPIPCTVSWDAMRGDHAVRHCGECKQSVYNLASFTPAEAAALLTARSGRVCLRIFRRPDGTVLTADCRERLRAARKRGVLVWAGVLLLVLWAQIGAQIFGWMSLRRLLGVVEPPADETVRTMGLVAPPRHETMGEPTLLLGKRAAPSPRH
jgi:hypothetical protein